MRKTVVALGLIAVSAAASGAAYMALGEPEEVATGASLEKAVRAEKASAYGGRANATTRTTTGTGHLAGLATLSGEPEIRTARPGPPSATGLNGRRIHRSAGDASVDFPKTTGAVHYAPGEVLVANAPSNFENIAVSQGYRVLEVVQLRSLDLKVLQLRTPSNVSVSNAVRRLRQQFPLAVSDANTFYELSGGAGLPESYARMLIGWPDVPKNCGDGVHLGMIDAGIQPGHPALAGIDIHYRSFHQNGRQPASANHGTAVAAMMVGKALPGKGWGGLLPGARLTAANIFQFGANRKITARARGLLEAIDWMAEQGVHVVNMSIAGSNNQVVREVVEKARNMGLVLVAAAGNWGSAAGPAYPAAYSDVIAVTAIDAHRNIYEFANSGRYIDFAAPGVRVWTAIPGGGQYQSGTSFASPYVSVLTGLFVSRGHPRDPEAIRKTLRRRIIDLGMPGRDDVFGWGLIDTQPRCVHSARALDR